MAAVAVESRAVQLVRGVVPRQCRRRILDLVEHAADVILDGFERRRHLGDALPDQVLKIARLENADGEVGNVQCQSSASKISAA
jgi:hypothetical protein